MHKYFELLLDLLEIEEKEPYLSLASQLEKLPANAQILIAHRAKFILSSYLDLLKGEMAPEEFILLGDLESAVPLWQQGQQNSENLIHQLNKGFIPDQEVIVLDLVSWNLILDPVEQDQLRSSLESHHKTLILG